MQKITPFLWFEKGAKEAMDFYVSVFKNSKVVEARKLPGGNMMTGTFEIEGQKFYVINGGPMFKFSPAISFFVNCETQEEIDELWQKLSEGGKTNQCGWLDDKFGVTWQIVPSVLGSLIGGSDPVKAQRAMQAMLKMTKLDIAALQKAYDGE